MYSEKVHECKVVVGRRSQCIHRMIQNFLSHGIRPLFFIVYGFLPILILGFFGPFWENGGYCVINSQLPNIYGEMNNDILDQFWQNLIVKVKMEGIMVGL